MRVWPPKHMKPSGNGISFYGPKLRGLHFAKHPRCHFIMTRPDNREHHSVAGLCELSHGVAPSGHVINSARQLSHSPSGPLLAQEQVAFSPFSAAPLLPFPLCLFHKVLCGGNFSGSANSNCHENHADIWALHILQMQQCVWKQLAVFVLTKKIAQREENGANL